MPHPARVARPTFAHFTIPSMAEVHRTWAPWLATIQRYYAAHRRARHLIVRVGVAFCILATTLLVIAWNMTPSTAHLADRVHGQDALHHTPFVPTTAIAPVMSQALIAIEDERFYQHHGIDVIGLVRAAGDDLGRGSGSRVAAPSPVSLPRMLTCTAMTVRSDESWKICY